MLFAGWTQIADLRGRAAISTEKLRRSSYADSMCEAPECYKGELQATSCKLQGVGRHQASVVSKRKTKIPRLCAPLTSRTARGRSRFARDDKFWATLMQA